MTQLSSHTSKASLTTYVPDARDALANFINTSQGSNQVRIKQIKKLAGGAIQENWLLDIETKDDLGSHEQQLVLRTDSPSSVQVSMTRSQEYSVLSCAYQAGVKVPEPLWYCDDTSILGREFFLMTTLQGTASGHQLTTDEIFKKSGPAICRELGESLANLHTIKPPNSKLDFLPTPAKNHARSCIEEYRVYLDSLDEVLLTLEWGLRWCELNLPEPESPRLLHRDFRTGNYMVHAGKLSGVLDWEFASWGDPREDIGWFTARCWRFSRPDREAGGIGSLTDFLRGYNSISSLRISDNDLLFWQVMAHIRWAIIALQQVKRYTIGGDDELELALTGHIIPELEQEILLLTGANS